MSSEVDLDTEVETSLDGVTVRKRFEAEEFPVPAIRFEITSDRDEPVSVSLAEKIPEEFPMDGVGFHPDYDSDNWTAFQDHHVEYQRTVEPDESVVTVYGVRIDSPEDATKFLDDPEIASVASEVDESDQSEGGMDETTIDEIASESDDEAVKDMISGDGDGLPGLEDDDDVTEAAADSERGDLNIDLDVGEEEDASPADGEDDGPSIDIDIDGAQETGETATEEAETDEESEDEREDVEAEAEPETDTDSDAEPDHEPETEAEPETDAETPDPEQADRADHATPPEQTTGHSDEESMVAALAAELESGDVSAADRRALRDALDPGPSGAEMAKVEHLQSRVEEVAAYADAIEQFLDEEGTGQQLIDEFEANVAALQDDVAGLADDLAAHGDRVDDVTATIDDHDDRIEDLSTDADAIRTDLDETADDLQTDVADLDDRADDIEADLDEATDDLETRIGDLSDDLEATDGDVDSVQSELEDLREDVEEIQEWRSQLGEMFGG